MLAGRYEEPTSRNYVELFDGTSWSNNPADLNTARYNPQGSGVQTAALIFGGGTPGGKLTATESYNGTSWTTLNSLNTARDSGAGSGTQTSSICYGGTTPAASGATELWNGTSWTTNPNSMNTARGDLNNTLGTAPATLAIGSGPANLSVESWTGPGAAVTQTVTVS